MSPLLLVKPTWNLRVESWKARVRQEANLLSYMVVLRMSPVPPHSVVNIVSPHMGVGLGVFWLSTALGTAAISFIHVTVGKKLDEMTTPAEMHLLSWHNALLLGLMTAAALVPVVVRKLLRFTPLGDEAVPEGHIALPDDGPEDYVPVDIEAYPAPQPRSGRNCLQPPALVLTPPEDESS